MLFYTVNFDFTGAMSGREASSVKTLLEIIEVDLNRFADVEACGTGEILHLYMAETESKTEYRRIGGSYFDATVDIKDVISDQLCLPDGVTPLTCLSPNRQGKALLQKKPAISLKYGGWIMAVCNTRCLWSDNLFGEP